jgi:diguanylate cyclase (GGDEF)-like protein
VTAAFRHRELVVSSSLAGFAITFAALVLFETPGLGIAHFFYLPVAALAMTGGVRRGVCAGLLASGLFSSAVALNSSVPTATQLFSFSMPIRVLTFTSIGALIGWFAAHDRELVSRLQLLAERDFLTGLPNTRAFEAAVARRLSSGRPFTLLLGDMDGLKQINDVKGHAEGNDALRRLAEMLGSVLRPHDEVARVGGHEFAVITVLSGGEDAPAAAARLESVLERQGVRITFGWALYPAEGENALSLYRAADERLYARKLVRGGDRVSRSLFSVAGSRSSSGRSCTRARRGACARSGARSGRTWGEASGRRRGRPGRSWPSRARRASRRAESCPVASASPIGGCTGTP